MIPFPKKKVLRIFKVSALLYGLLGILAYYLQDTVLFNPETFSKSEKISLSLTSEELYLPYNKTDTIHVVRFRDTGNTKPKGAVLFLHSASGNVGRCGQMAHLFAGLGYEVWIPDYPGYGKSTGHLDEAVIYEQLYQVRKLMSNYFDSSKVIIAGAELGACLAANLANFTANQQLILISPFYSMPHLLHSYTWIYPWSLMSLHQYPTGKYLQDVKIPVTVFYDAAYGSTTSASCNKIKAVLKPSDHYYISYNIRQQNGSGQKLFLKVMRDVLH